MDKVRITSKFGSFALDADQRRLFQEELQRVTQSPGATFDTDLDVGSDCTIVVEEGGQRTNYEIVGRCRLVESDSRKSWQFYMGLLLMEWYVHATAPRKT